VASIIVGSWVGSIALVGFGLDSFVESLSGMVMIWRFWTKRADEEAAEAKAVQLVGSMFFVLGCYVLFESGKSLYTQERPGSSIVGIVVAVASIVVMPIVSYLKYQLGKEIGSESLLADSKQSLACALLSVALLIGLTLNYAWGLWWADSTAGLLISLLLFWEGYETFEKGRTCC
jgi:divalent metal cation (Fe/Co/Zn/Cd) transporter